MRQRIETDPIFHLPHVSNLNNILYLRVES